MEKVRFNAPEKEEVVSKLIDWREYLHQHPETGFNNLSYFSTQFKNKYQLSPMKYRKKYQ